MSVDGEFLRFDGKVLVPVDFVDSSKLSVADSWLVREGKTIALEKHFERFQKWVRQISGQSNLDLTSFFHSVREVLPMKGLWFPRIEYRSESNYPTKLFIRMRPAPELSKTVSLWTYDEPDPRALPFVKGPDLSLCQQIRRAANLHGADEAVLVDADGFISDGALSSILWWRDGRLCGPDDSTNWLDSITRQEIFDIASHAGFETRTEKVKPADLSGCEVWSVSSLQGVRGVTSWEGVELGSIELSATFRKRLKLQEQLVR